MNKLYLDAAEAVEFLSDMKPDVRWHLVAIEEPSHVSAKTFEPSDTGGAKAWIEGRQGKANLYFHVAELKEGVRDRKARKGDVLETALLHVDIDHADALDRLKDFAPVPSVVVWSGNGAHAYWRLTRSIAPELAERINQQLAKSLGGDNCHNADRILRLPGTLNIPNAQKLKKGRTRTQAHVVAELTDYARVYNPDDFDAGRSVTSEALKITDFELKPVDIGGLPVNDFVKELIRNGDDVEHPIGSPNARYPSRSEAVFRVVCDLLRAGCADQVIASVLMDASLGISQSIRENQKPLDYVRRQLVSGARAVSNEWPDLSRGGGPRASYRNAMVALQRLGLAFAFDEFHRRKSVNGRQLQDFVGELTDDICARLRDLIIDTYEFDAGKDHIRDAANALCLQSTYHPVIDYLSALKWDGQPRLQGWLHRYLGAEQTELNAAIGAIVLIAAVRRVRKPGTKFDTIMVLEGAQGTGKSQSLHALAGQGNFSDQDILALDQKAQMEAMVGVWIFEIGELEGLSRADTTKVKAFASRSSDKARPAYGRFTETWPRQCVFIGTTNDDRYLRDVTGNRRFWPVRTGLIDLKAITEDRDQLWAEAASREASGTSIVLPETLWAEAGRIQETRLEEDPWIDSLAMVAPVVVAEYERVSTATLFEKLGFEDRNLQNHHTKRLAGVMRKLGWQGPKPVKISGQLVRGYERPRNSSIEGLVSQGEPKSANPPF